MATAFALALSNQITLELSEGSQHREHLTPAPMPLPMRLGATLAPRTGFRVRVNDPISNRGSQPLVPHADLICTTDPSEIGAISTSPL
jgi:hypothetical protein